MEESDILRRASCFLNSVKPDPQFLLPPTDVREETIALAVASISPADDSLGVYEQLMGGFSLPPLPTTAQPVYVINEKSYLLFKDNRFRAELPLGEQY